MIQIKKFAFIAWGVTTFLTNNLYASTIDTDKLAQECKPVVRTGTPTQQDNLLIYNLPATTGYSQVIFANNNGNLALLKNEQFQWLPCKQGSLGCWEAAKNPLTTETKSLTVNGKVVQNSTTTTGVTTHPQVGAVVTWCVLNPTTGAFPMVNAVFLRQSYDSLLPQFKALVKSNT